MPIWFSLGSAHLAADELDEAAEWFSKVARSSTERVYWPIPYVRSFYFLGVVHERVGETDTAREHYRRFLDYWQEGDLDCARVREVQEKLRHLARVAYVP